MFRKMMLALALVAMFQPVVWSAPKVTLEDRVIGSSFKSLAKAYVATANIEALKATNIRKLKCIRKDRFVRRYNEVYPLILSLPEKLRAKYGVTPDMTREQAIRIVHSLDKQKLYEIIDAIPNDVIAQQFRQELAQNGCGAKGSSPLACVGEVWGKVTDMAQKEVVRNK